MLPHFLQIFIIIIHKSIFFIHINLYIKLINYCKQIVFDLPKVRPRCTRYNGVLLEQEANNMKLFLS